MKMRRKVKKSRQEKSKNRMEKLCEKLARRLPNMLSTAIQSYERITIPPHDGDAKSYAALHGAAKAALSHIESLLKLAKGQAFEEVKVEKQDDNLQSLIKAAKAAVASEEIEGERE